MLWMGGKIEEVMMTAIPNRVFGVCSAYILHGGSNRWPRVKIIYSKPLMTLMAAGVSRSD